MSDETFGDLARLELIARQGEATGAFLVRLHYLRGVVAALKAAGSAGATATVIAAIKALVPDGAE